MLYKKSFTSPFYKNSSTFLIYLFVNRKMEFCPLKSQYVVIKTWLTKLEQQLCLLSNYLYLRLPSDSERFMVMFEMPKMQYPYEIITFWVLLLIVIISQNQALEMSTIKILTRCFPGGSLVKNPSARAGDMGLIADWERSHTLWSK